jgi:hypothetical protein
VVLYGCETWSLTLREEHRLRVFENRVLRGIFGPKREEVIGGWRKLHNEELHNLYCSPNIIGMMNSRRMRWAGHVAYTGEKGNAYKILVECRKERDHVASFIETCVDFGAGVDAMEKRKFSSLPDIDQTVTVKQYEFIVQDIV